MVRLLARNAAGNSPPSEGTAIRPGPSGGCVSEIDWQPNGPRDESTPPISDLSISGETGAGRDPIEGQFHHEGASGSSNWFSSPLLLLLLLLLSLMLGG
eukprot:2179263-Prymnesium_polylepis.1